MGEDPKFSFDLLKVDWRVFGMLLPLSKYLVCCAKCEPDSGVLPLIGRSQGGEILRALWAWLV